MTWWNKNSKKKDTQPHIQPARTAVSDDAGPVSSAREMPLRAEENGTKGADILVAPHTTEKTTDSATRGIYVFKVTSGANKRTVAEAVARHYGVAVDCVRMAVQPAKERRRGRQIGWKRGFKKAMVQLKEGQHIETL